MSVSYLYHRSSEARALAQKQIDHPQIHSSSIGHVLVHTSLPIVRLPLTQALRKGSTELNNKRSSPKYLMKINKINTVSMKGSSWRMDIWSSLAQINKKL